MSLKDMLHGNDRELAVAVTALLQTFSVAAEKNRLRVTLDISEECISIGMEPYEPYRPTCPYGAMEINGKGTTENDNDNAPKD